MGTVTLGPYFSEPITMTVTLKICQKKSTSYQYREATSLLLIETDEPCAGQSETLKLQTG